jgi:FixJ family two-component response regulator
MIPAPCVFLVDDQPAILKALTRLLTVADLKVVAFESAQTFLNSTYLSTPGCLILDLSMPGMSGLALQAELNLRGSILPVIYLTGTGDLDSGIQAMKQGAIDFLTKPVDGDKLIKAVHIAIEKSRLDHVTRVQLDDLERRLHSLTARELEVLYLVVKGKLNKQIAEELGTAEQTIKAHRAKVMTKMEVSSLADLVRLADKAAPLRVHGNRND